MQISLLGNRQKPVQTAHLGSLAFFLGVVVLLSSCAELNSEDGTPVITKVTDASGAPLGSVAVPVSCAPDVATHLRRGVALLHNMTYTQAEEEFRVASEQDEECALAYWGMAMSYVHPLWPDVPSDDDFERGVNLLVESRNHGPLAGREDAYVSALEAYYQDWQERSESERLSSYFEGWEKALAAYPDDIEVQLFRALSLNAAATTSDSMVEMQTEAGEMAEAVLERVPDHTGALHYIIHAYDLPELAERALPVARIYGEIASENQHALHMTSHIFTRVGSWEESITYNQRSAEVALKNPINGTTSFHYLHAADYLAYAFLQRADDDGARQVWSDVASIEGPIYDNAGSAYAFAAIPARIVLERQNWAAAAQLRTRWPSTVVWDKYPQFEAITQFARGLGAARTGDIGAAEAAVVQLSDLRTRAAAAAGAYDWGTQVQVQEVTVRAWIAYAKGQESEALVLMNEAQELDATTRKNPVTPGHVLPAAELYGDMLLALNRYDEALLAYEATLRRSPGRLNSLYGAGRSAELGGDNQKAADYYRTLIEMTTQTDTELEALRHARSFMAQA